MEQWIVELVDLKYYSLRVHESICLVGRKSFDMQVLSMGAMNGFPFFLFLHFIFNLILE